MAQDLENEAAMYGALAALPGLTYLSVGHRPSLLRFHSARLRLYGMDRSPCFDLEAIEANSEDEHHDEHSQSHRPPPPPG